MKCVTMATDVITVFIVCAVFLQITDTSNEMYSFQSTNGKALEGHVKETITKAHVQYCWADCVWLPWCFSINVRETRDMVECELNNSSKKGSPSNMAAKEGWSYHQMKDVSNNINCKLYNCRIKEAFSDGWYRVDNAAFKLFTDNKTWSDARSHCQSLGGDLLSITSSQENDFIKDFFVSQLNLTYVRKDQPDIGIPYSHWALDGREQSVKLPPLSSSVKYVHDEKEGALFFDQTNAHATIPGIALNPEGFTVGIWVKVLYRKISKYFISVRTADTFRVILVLYSTIGTNSTYTRVKESLVAHHMKYEQDVWNHMAVSWNASTKQVKFVMSGKPPFVSQLNIPSQPYVHVGKEHNGFLKHLVFYNVSLDDNQIKAIASNPDTGIPYSHWKLDGSEKSIKFYGGKKFYQNDENEMALYSNDDSSYAAIPEGGLNPAGFTVGIWAKTLNSTKYKKYRNIIMIYTPNTYHRLLFLYYIADYQPLQYGASLQNSYVARKRFEYNKWHHIVVSWNASTKVVKYSIDGDIYTKTMGFTTVALGNDHYGLLKHLVMSNTSLNVSQMRTFSYWNTHGPWIGLYNKGQTSEYTWTDGTPVENYQFPLPPDYQKYPTTRKKCVIITQDGKWVDKYCEMKYPYICKKRIS